MQLLVDLWLADRGVGPLTKHAQGKHDQRSHGNRYKDGKRVQTGAGRRRRQAGIDAAKDRYAQVRDRYQPPAAAYEGEGGRDWDDHEEPSRDELAGVMAQEGQRLAANEPSRSKEDRAAMREGREAIRRVAQRHDDARYDIEHGLVDAPKRLPKKRQLAGKEVDLDAEAAKPEHRKRAKETQRKVRAEAAKTAKDAAAEMDRWGFSAITPPPKASRQRDALGRSRQVRQGAGGEWDWFDSLPQGEQKRLRRHYLSGSAVSPDVAADMMGQALGRTLSVDDAMAMFVRQTKLIDGGKALARGKLPKYVSAQHLSPSLAESGMTASELMGPDPTRHMLEVEHDRRKADRAERVERGRQLVAKIAGQLGLFDEHAHPRDDHGRFSSGSGSAGARKAPGKPEATEAPEWRSMGTTRDHEGSCEQCGTAIKVGHKLRHLDTGEDKLVGSECAGLMCLPKGTPRAAARMEREAANIAAAHKNVQREHDGHVKAAKKALDEFEQRGVGGALGDLDGDWFPGFKERRGEVQRATGAVITPKQHNAHLRAVVALDRERPDLAQARRDLLTEHFGYPQAQAKTSIAPPAGRRR